MSQSQEQFDEVLSFFKDYLDSIVKYEGYEPDFTDEVIEQMELLYRVGSIPLAIEIMESSIFREGSLKGRKISGKHRLYPILDAKEFVIELLGILGGLEYIKNRKQTLSHEFDSILRAYDRLSKAVLEYKGIRPEKVKAIRHDLAAMKDRTIIKLSPISSLPPDIMPSLIALFKKYVSTAPNQTIAARISELLKMVGFQVNQETIRKKLQAQISTV
jgi:hypothetical protein